jgi:hypothetical protein
MYVCKYIYVCMCVCVYDISRLRVKMTNRCVNFVVYFIKVFQIFPRHVAAGGCHLQAVIDAL